MASKNRGEDASKNDNEKKATDVFTLLLEQIQNIDLNKIEEEQLENKTKEIIAIPKWLEAFESPFLWYSKEVRSYGPEHCINWSLEKLQEINIENPDFSDQRFMCMLKLVFECYIIGKLDESCAIMKEIEALLEKDVSKDNTLYQKVKLPLRHLVLTTKAQLLFLQGQEDESRKIGRDIIPVKTMGAHDRAAFYAMKARFYLYSGFEKSEDTSVELARQAVRLDPEYAEWKYLLAKMLRQQRRNAPFSVEIPKEELILMEEAIKGSQNAEYLVYLAQVYRECAKQVFLRYKGEPGFFRSDLHRTTMKMNREALLHYKEALGMAPKEPSTLRRVGYGIMNLPPGIANYDLALSCLLRSLEISNNQMTLHILGTFYNRYGNDNIKALKYFEETVVHHSFCGLIDMIRVKHLLDSTYDPSKDLESGLKWQIKRKDRTSLLVQLAGYFLLFKRDFQKSLEYFNKVMSEDKDSEYMKTFKSIFLSMAETIDLNYYLVNEALLLLRKTTTGSKEKDTITEFLNKMRDSQPNLLCLTPDPTLIETLHRKSDARKAHYESASRKPRNARNLNNNRI